MIFQKTVELHFILIQNLVECRTIPGIVDRRRSDAWELSRVVGEKCHFPFVDMGIIYSGCVPSTIDQEGSWCYTDNRTIDLYYGYCDTTCPKAIDIGEMLFCNILF